VNFYPDDGYCSVFRNVGKPSTAGVAYSRKLKKASIFIAETRTRMLRNVVQRLGQINSNYPNNGGKINFGDLGI
jgi:hypothetical protein